MSSAEQPQKLYAAREPVFPKRVYGPFRNLKWIIMIVTLGIYYLTPWIRWDRGPSLPDQAVLLDLANRRFFFFWIEIWPHEFYFVAGLLIMAGLGLFLFTSALGRVWCGYACPQTVWTDLFYTVERWIEGDRNARLRLWKQKWDARKVRLRVTKYIAWFLIAVATGGAWVFYFTDAPTLFMDLVTLQAPYVAYATIGILTATTFVFGGFMREQVCIYMCPYARFQSAMIDRNTLMISYDPKRGDPRGARKRGTDPKTIGKGDCIDCGLCVQVCPTGIDIRDGLQYQCIGCAACIDVCDDVMEKMGYEKGLIKYTTENALEGQKTEILRPRLFVYIGIISLVSLMLFYALLVRVPLEVDIMRDRAALFNENRKGLIENVYNLKVINMDKDTHRYTITVDGMDGIEVKGGASIEVESGEVADLPLRVQVPPTSIRERSSEVFFNISTADGSGIELREPARFLGPVPR